MDDLHAGFEEFRRYVNPLIAQRAGLAGEPIELMRVVDGVPQDRSGKPMEDFHGTQSLGHRLPAVAEAVQRYLQTDHLSWYPSRVSPYAGRLARRLAERTGYDNAWFGCTGSDAVEASLKLARALTGRPRILSVGGAYHGCTFGSCSLMQPGPFRDPFGPFVSGVSGLPFDDVDALERELSTGDVAAVITEPWQVEGGVRAPGAEWLDAVCRLTEKHGTLLIADEVQTGLGRTGEGFLYTSTAWPRRPDVVVLAKALGGGLLPVSAMLTTRETFLKAYGRDFATGESHNTTFSFNSMGMVAGLAMMDALTDERIARVKRVGTAFREKLAAAVAGSPMIREVRGVGLMFGIELMPIEHPWLSFGHLGMDALDGEQLVGPLLCHRLYRHGFFCFSCGHDWRIVRIQPRLNVPEATLDRFVQAVVTELSFLEGVA